jgi:hypothetical protein
MLVADIAGGGDACAAGASSNASSSASSSAVLRIGHHPIVVHAMVSCGNVVPATNLPES